MSYNRAAPRTGRVVAALVAVLLGAVALGAVAGPLFGGASDAAPSTPAFCDDIVSFNARYQAAEDRAATSEWTPAAVKLAYDEWLRLEEGLLAAAPPEVRAAQQVLVDGYEPVIEALDEVGWRLAQVDGSVFDYSDAERDALGELNGYLTKECAVPYFEGLGFGTDDARCLARELSPAGRSLYSDLARDTVVGALASCDLPASEADLWDY